MNNQLISKNIGFCLLYIPFIFSSLLSFNPNLSYISAWVGSFFIFYITFTEKIKPLDRDLPFSHQWMRPIFLPHVIFAGYMASGSIFYFLDKNGFYFLQPINSPAQIESLFNMAKCQRLYCLGHAALTHGLLIYTRPSTIKKTKTNIHFSSSLSLKIAIIFLTISQLATLLPNLDQFQIRFFHLGMVGVTITFALSLSEKKIFNTIISIILFIYIFINSFYSGMKEQLLIPLILLFVFLYPIKTKAVVFIAPIAIFLFFFFIPSYNTIVREEAWFGDLTTEEASDFAIEQIKSGSVDVKEKNWTFLTGRFSEIEMFEKYVDYVPANRDYYNFDILSQSIQTLLPRILFPKKGITEDMVMERAYDSGAFNENSAGSAKPSPITDGYLSFGYLGAWLICFIIGISSSYISRTAESLFGGYQVGSGLIYTGLFQIFWRGNSMEFMMNTIFWSIIIMYVLYYIGIKLFIIQHTS